MDQENGMDLEDGEDNRTESEGNEPDLQDQKQDIPSGSGTRESRPSTTEPILNPPGDEAIQACKLKIRRLRGHYNDSYRLLFNDMVTEASDRFNDSESTPLAPSQIGVSAWTAEEKESFFNAGEVGAAEAAGIRQGGACRGRAGAGSVCGGCGLSGGGSARSVRKGGFLSEQRCFRSSSHAHERTADGRPADPFMEQGVLNCAPGQPSKRKGKTHSRFGQGIVCHFLRG